MKCTYEWEWWAVGLKANLKLKRETIEWNNDTDHCEMRKQRFAHERRSYIEYIRVTCIMMCRCKNEHCDKHFSAMIAIWNSRCREASAPSSMMSLVKEQPVIFYFLNDLVNEWNYSSSLSITHSFFLVQLIVGLIRDRGCYYCQQERTKREKELRERYLSLAGAQLFNEMFIFQTNS